MQDLDFVTVEQKVVVNHKLKQGYELFGTTNAMLNGMTAFVLNKGRHLIVVNSLGYDEHFAGKTWNIK